MASFLHKALAVGEGRALKNFSARLPAIAALEERMQDETDDALVARFAVLREQVQAEELTLDDVLIEVMAIVREVGWRTLGLRLYDEQLIGAQALHAGMIAEMRTGEGKTFACVPAVALRSLTGKGVHVVTVNDYLAERDAQWMGPVYQALGISVGVIVPGLDSAARREAYACDVTYGTNSEFGFDYLRDNMATTLDETVQRGHAYCIVDEVDSILIDEARTPLIISGAPESAADTYYRFARVVPTLRAGEDYEVDEKRKTASPTESGVHKIERALGIENLYIDIHGQLVNHLIQALKAHSLYHRDKQYIVRDGEVLIVDEFTGRILEGRRYSEGLHQAIEAKEGLAIQEENQTLATITLQNYFRMYRTLAGMTGTAATEATEFTEIYGCHVLEIPPHRPVVREDAPDLVFATERAKFEAVIDEVAACQSIGQPVLIGTASVSASERLSAMMKRRSITHAVLNAKQHEQEAAIIAEAGQQGAVTIATNMAGRGVDIALGDGVAEQGGLYVLGTERHESRRIDNQLRGRSGRQGDPGRSQFFVSGEDELIRLFAGDKMQNILERFGGEEGAPLESKMLTKRIAGAQKKVEERNFAIRKQVLEYDDVLNAQRQAIYSERREILEGVDLSDQARQWVVETIVARVDAVCAGDSHDWDLESLCAEIHELLDLNITPADLAGLEHTQVLDVLEDRAMDAYDAREADLGAELMRELERWVVLQMIDIHWREHLHAMDMLREGIHWRGLAQKQPLAEYRLEGRRLFDETMDAIRDDFTRYLFHLELEQPPEPVAAPEPVAYSAQEDPLAAPEVHSAVASAPVAVATPVVKAEHERVGRNDPCWCGSGKKFKRCHGG